MYFLCVASGETQWVFETGDAVKSCPAVDPVTGLVIVGSHDGHVYGLNPKVRVIVSGRHSFLHYSGAMTKVTKVKRVFCFLGSSVCLEASLWGWSCVFLPVPPLLPQTAVCCVIGRTPTMSQSCE